MLEKTASRRCRTVVAALALSTLTVAAGAPAASASPPGAEGGATSRADVAHHETADLAALVALQVQNRVADGVPAQGWSINLATAADRWAHKMAADSDAGAGPAALVHSQPGAPLYFGDAINQSYYAAAENIAWSSGGPDHLNTLWLNSPPHRRALSDPAYNRFGIGIAHDGQGRLWATAIFARYDGDPDDPSTDHPRTTPPSTPVQPPATPAPPGGPTNPPVPVPVPVPVPGPAPVPTVTVTPVFGPDRYATSLAVTRRAVPGSREIVVVSGADGNADALAGGPLAASLGAGLVLTGRDALPDEVAAHVVAQRITKVYVVGGSGSVSPAVTDQLSALGATVERIGGSDRFETSVKVAAMPSLRGSSTVVVAGGYALPDAVSAGGIAGALHAPIVLVPRGGALPEGLYDSTRARGTVVVVGSAGAVGTDVADQVGATLRLGGSDRYETSLAIAAWGLRSGVPADAVAVTTAEGASTADALAAAAFGRVTLLTPAGGWSDGVRRFLVDNTVGEVYTVGGRTPRA